MAPIGLRIGAYGGVGATPVAIGRAEDRIAVIHLEKSQV
jgi:hypothetical protein